MPCADAGIQPTDLNLVVPHQANARIVEAVRQRAGISMDRMVNDIGDTGNTSSTTIPLCLANLLATQGSTTNKTTSAPSRRLHRWVPPFLNCRPSTQMPLFWDSRRSTPAPLDLSSHDTSRNMLTDVAEAARLRHRLHDGCLHLGVAGICSSWRMTCVCIDCESTSSGAKPELICNIQTPPNSPRNREVPPGYLSVDTAICIAQLLHLREQTDSRRVLVKETVGRSLELPSPEQLLQWLHVSRSLHRDRRDARGTSATMAY